MDARHHRFLPSQRIRHSLDFNVAMKQGARLSIGCFLCFYIKNTHDYPRLGMMIAKKHCKLAVTRNRIKRLIRERFRHNQMQYAGMDVVILLRASSDKISEEEQSECLEKLFSQLVARCGGSALA